MKTIEYINGELKKYTTIDRFSPVEKIVYGMVGIILTGFFGAVVTLVIKGIK